MAQLIITSLRTHHVGPISLTIEKGQCAAVLGQSGSGKTLMLRAIADLDPHEGDVFLDGKSFNQFTAPQWHKNVGYLCAKPLWWLDNVDEHFNLRGNSQLESYLSQWLNQLNLRKDILLSPTQRLSTGEQQRLALLRLLLNLPKVLLLDEASASLDQKNTHSMEMLIRQYQQERQCAILWITHDIAQAQRIADNIYRLEQGSLRNT